MSNNKNMADEIKGCRAFLSLRPIDIEALSNECSWLKVERGESVFAPGDPSDCLFLLVQGRAVLTHRQNSKRAIVQSICPNELFGHSALVLAGQRDSTCEAIVRTSAIRIPVQPVQQLMETGPQLVADLMREYDRATRQLTNRLVSVLIQPKRQRLIEALKVLAKWCGTNNESGRLIPRGVTHQELGDMIGATRETVTVILSELRREHVIDFIGRRIVLLTPGEM